MLRFLVDSTLPALTLHQPWATLIAIGAKRYETRSWPTAYRGPIAIHAAKRFDDQQRYLCETEPFQSVLRRGGYPISSMLPLGCVVAVAYVATCSLIHPASTQNLSSEEVAFGDWRSGRYAWHMRDVARLDPPIAARGYQGIWTWTVPSEHESTLWRHIR
jgi:hypothetical protein